ncbi:hypothetical protein PAEPH01_2202, partial [Pancytospora epiphaga]
MEWIKSHIGSSMRSPSAGAVYAPQSTKVVTNPTDTLAIWAEHFRSLCVKGVPIDTINNRKSTSNAEIMDFMDAPVTWAEISATIKRTRRGKAAGLDRVPGEIYKLVENKQVPESGLAKSIMAVVNEVYSGSVFPKCWKGCVLVPVFKKGDPKDPNNYRGISLINTLLKILAKVLASRLQYVCTAYNLIRR